MNKQIRSVFSSTIWGLVLCVGALWFWYSLVGNPLHDLALIRHGQTVPGFIVDTWEDAESGDEGGTQWMHGARYTYRVPDGQEFTQRTKTNSGRLTPEFRDLAQPVLVEVEYLPDNPSVSRIKGDGSPDLFDWLWREVGLGILMLALFLAPGVAMLRTAVRDFKKYNRTLKEQDD